MTPVEPKRSDVQYRATFIHPDGQTVRTDWGQAYAPDSSTAYVSEEATPDWVRDPGVEVVVADENGSVDASFVVGAVTADGHATVVHAP